jgi:TetR/AcrR family transcriptional regulator
MTGRREQRRIATTRAIVTAASRLFVQRGYDETSIEVVADEAGVSPGTIYNYFGTKGALLLAVVAEDLGDGIGTGGWRPVEGADPLDVIVSMVVPLADAMVGLGRDLLRHVISAGFDPSQAPALDDLVAIDERAIATITTTLIDLQRRGMLAEGVDPGAAGILVYSIVATTMLMYASDATMGRDDVLTAIRSQMSVAWDGLAP